MEKLSVNFLAAMMGGHCIADDPHITQTNTLSAPTAQEIQREIPQLSVKPVVVILATQLDPLESDRAAATMFYSLA